MAEVSAPEVIAALQQMIANQALEIAKAQALINQRDQELATLRITLDAYEAPASAAS